MQTLIVIFIIFLALYYLIRTIINRKDESSQCGCGCSSCSISTDCSETAEKKDL